MAQYQELKRKGETVQQAAKHDVPPPLSINLPKISDLPNKTKPWSEDILPVDILLLTGEDCEFLACYAYMRNSFKTYQRNLGYVYFGNMGESEEEPLKVALMRCSKGFSGPGGSQTVTTNAVMQLRPKVVYSVGCKGLNPEDTKLGDVVISSKLTTAEASKIPVGREISNLIKYAADGWNPPLKRPEGQEVQVHRDSEILSGIHPDSAKRHRVSHSEAIASESQGKGIFVAAHDLKFELVIVKGISHFADETNAPDKSWKSYACVMAASLVSNMLKNPVVFKDWPHYEGVEEPRKRKSPSEDTAIAEARRDVRLTESVQEPPREKQALATHHEEGATTKMMGDVQLFEGLRPQQRYEPQLMAGQGAVEQGPDKTKLHEGIVTSEGTDWDLKVGAVHLQFPPNAVSEPTSIVVHKWKHSACSPPLQEHEAIVSNVIEISTITGEALEFNAEVKLFLSHSAPDLQGYELVIKKQIDKESNEWEDVDGTEDLKCLQGIKDDIPPHKDILDMFFPVARVDITKCSTYAVVCRLKSSPPYTITSSGGSFSHPDYPGVTVTIPENAVAPEAKFPLELKVQEVLSEDFEGKDVFIGPILRISCPQVVQFLKPVTIQLPASLRDEEQEIPDPSTCRVRVFFLRSDGEHKEWIEITGDLAKPAIFDGKFVMFQVERFSGYGACVDCGQRNENVSVTDLLSRTNYVPIQVFFFACFRPDSQEILLLYCCPAYLRSEVRQELEREDIKYSDGSSKVKMTPERDDKVFVFLSGGIEAFSTKDMEDFNLLLDRFSPSKLELRVRLVSDRDMAQVEFRSNPKPERSIVLCKLYPPISTPRVQDMGSEGRTRQHGVEKPTEKNTRQNGCKDDRATGTTMSDVQPAQGRLQIIFAFY